MDYYTLHPWPAPLLLQWIAIILALWAVARLIISVIAKRFLHNHISIGHVGWTCISDIEWNTIRHSTSKKNNSSTTTSSSSSIQKIHIRSLALTIRSRGAKDNNIKYGWLGLAIKGVTATLHIRPAGKQPEEDNHHVHHHGDDGAEDDNELDTLDTSSSQATSTPRTNTFGITPTPSTLNFKNLNGGKLPSSTSSSQESTGSTKASFSFRDCAILTAHGIKTVHETRRKLRQMFLSVLPDRQRRLITRWLNRTTRLVRHRLVAPLLTQINHFGRACNKITMFLALEIADITFDIPQIESQIKLGLIRIGGEMVRGKENHIGVWGRIEQLILVSLPTSDTSKSAHTSTPRDPGSSRSPPPEMRLIEMPGPLLVEARADFDPSIGMAGLYHRDENGRLEPRKTILDLSFAFLRASSTFGGDKRQLSTNTGVSGIAIPSSIKVRLNGLLELGDRFEKAIALPPRPHLGPHLGPHIHNRDFDRDSETAYPVDSRSRTISSASYHQAEAPIFTLDGYSTLPPIPARRNPTAMLKSISMCVPLIKVEASIPNSVKSSSTKDEDSKVETEGSAELSSSSMLVEVRLRGLAAEISTGHVLAPQDRHVPWFGKHTTLKVASKLGFEKFDIDALFDTSGKGPLARPVRLLEISPSGAHLSSTWLPPRIDALFEESYISEDHSDFLQTSTFGIRNDLNSPRGQLPRSNKIEASKDEKRSGQVIFEADVGGINGEGSFEILQDILAMLDGRKIRRGLSPNADNDVNTSSMHENSKFGSPFLEPPTVVMALEFGRCGYRVLGPQTLYRATFGPGEDDADVSIGWGAPSLLCAHINGFSANLTTRYADVPLQRTEAQRQEIKQQVRRGSVGVPEILLSASVAQRKPAARMAARKIFDSPNPDESQEGFSQSMSPSPSMTGPSALKNSFAADGEPVVTASGGRPENVRMNASCFKEHDLLCFITPDSGKLPEYARRNAANHSGTTQQVAEHPFVYFVDAAVRFQSVDVYLLGVQDGRSDISDIRANPTSASSERYARPRSSSRARNSSQQPPRGHGRRLSKASLNRRHDVAIIGPGDLNIKLELLGSEAVVPGEVDSLEEAEFISAVDLANTHGSIVAVIESVHCDLTNLEVHHCISAMLQLQRNRPETPCNGSTAPSSEESAGRKGKRYMSASTSSTMHSCASTVVPDHEVKPLAHMLPPNIHFSAALASLNIHVAGPDPKFMPDTCRGIALQISQLGAQYYRQDRYVVPQAHSHVRAPLGLANDPRSHAQASFEISNTPDQAFISIYVRGLGVNPVKDSGRDSRILRARTPVDGQGRATTENIERISISDTKWCNLPRYHFFPKKDEDTYELPAGKSGRVKSRKYRTRDYFQIPEIDMRVTLWTKPTQSADQEDQTAADVSISKQQEQDQIGLVVRIPEIYMRLEVFQVYCFLMAFSALRSFKDTQPSSTSQDRSQPAIVRIKPRLQLKVNVTRIHIYCTLPHDVKLYLGLRRVELSTHNEDDVHLQVDSGLVAAESKICAGMWEEVIKIRKWNLIAKHEANHSGYQSRTIFLRGDAGRLRIPCKYPFSEIVDNVVTFVKVLKQLVHQFVKGEYGSAIEPHPEEPKKLPDIRIALGVLVFEAADDPFEAKLNLIWNAGQAEQNLRQTREEAFERKRLEIEAEEAAFALRLKSHSHHSAETTNGGHDFQSGILDPTGQDGSTLPTATMRKRASLAHARQRLDKANSAKWISRYRDALGNRTRYQETQLKKLYGGVQMTSLDDIPIQIVDHRGVTPLFRGIFDNIDIRLSPPTFDAEPDGLQNFLYDVGKGVPRDTQYSILVPFHLDWRMGEAKITVRDYPVPLLYVPPAQADDESDPDADSRSWHWSTDFVIGEQMGDHNGVRRVSTSIVPTEYGRSTGHGSSRGYFMSVPRTAMPIKFFAEPVINIKSDYATKVAWGNSMQPAIQDIMRVLDALTKAPPDPSERVGFWDKIRLILHWRIQVNFTGKGPLHMLLKGSRDPYAVQGIGAGFALSWHDNIKWHIGFPNKDNEFFQISSDRFLLGVPDLRDYVAVTQTGQMKERPRAPLADDRFSHGVTVWSEMAGADRKEQKLSKVCAKFQGGVKWGLGMQFERTCRDESCSNCSGASLFKRQCRLFHFLPHYQVRTISGKDAVGLDLKTHDSYAGFRSDFIHFSLSVTANQSDASANTIHLTPNGFTHFWAWWHLFDGTLSLPIRHGKIFESSLPPSKKFGKHCATIKYRFQLAPVYISHTYKQDIPSDSRRGLATVLGVKGRIESFNVDLHQREQEERTRDKDSGEIKIRLHKAFHRAEVDCKNTDLRVISARFQCESGAASDSESEEAEFDFLDMDAAEPVDPEDTNWIDTDDFIDLYSILGDLQPNVHLLSCLKTPRLTYSRYSQHDTLYTPLSDDESAMDKPGMSDGSPTDSAASEGPLSKFGTEETHTCLLDAASDAVEVQLEVLEKRVAELERMVETADSPTSDKTPKSREELHRRLKVAKMGVARFKMYRSRKFSTSSMPDGAEKAAQEAEYAETLREREDIPSFNVFDDLDMWINRLLVHDPTVVVSQRIRDILLRYYYSSRQRRFFLYAMTARAIKFIREHAKDHQKQQKKGSRNAKDYEFAPGDWEGGDLLDELIREVTGTTTKKSAIKDNDRAGDDANPLTMLRKQLAPNERARNSFLVSILKPQICLHSDNGAGSSTIIIASQAVQVRLCAVIDAEHADDPINATVRHRSFGRVDKLQAFYPHLSGWRSGRKEIVLHKVNTFVPLEVLSGLSDDTHDLDRIVAPTNARLTYDKVNRLRLVDTSKQGEHGQDRNMDRLQVDCERFTVNATPKHFGAIYDVVTNLLLYSDPGQKARSQKLEQLVLSKDFSDSVDIARNIERQQSDLRRCRDHFMQAFDRGLEAAPKSQRGNLRRTYIDMSRGREVLTLWMGAIQAAQASQNPSKSKSTRLDARAKEIVWHMRESDDTPLAKVAINDIYFRWQNHTDGGVTNSLVIRELLALNSGVDPYFPEILAKHPYPPSVMETRFMKADIFVAVIWSMLSPVGGISIVDDFQVHLHPIRLQMEQSIADKIKHYLFTQRETKDNTEDSESISQSHTGDTASTSSLHTSSDRTAPGHRDGARFLLKPKSSENLQNAKKGIETGFSQRNKSNSMLAISSASSQISQPPSRPRSVRRSPSREALDMNIVTRDDHLDANEMRERARLNRTFLHVELFPTILCLSFKGDKSTTLPDVYGLIYKSPTIIHCNRIWTYLDLLEHIKKDFKSSIWSQSATLLGQLLTTARKPKNVVQHHVQNRLLSHITDKDRGAERDRRRSFTSSFRSRLSPGQGDDTKASPLRSEFSNRLSEEPESDSDLSDDSGPARRTAQT